MANCPVCGQPIDTNDIQCPNCRINISFALAIASEKASNVIDKFATKNAISPEILVPRLGDFLISQKIITAEQLNYALTFQKDERKHGNDFLLGEALVHLNYISKSELDHAITEQIFELQDALQRSNQELEKRVQERASELQKALKKLTTLNKLKADFIANISHELRTPMSHIIGYVDLLRDESLGSLSQDQIMALDVIVKANEKIFILLDNLLQFSHFTEETIKIHKEEFSLNSFLPPIIEHNQTKAKNAKVEFLTNLPAKNHILLADKEKIEWVLEQLLDNAIKFNHSNGKVKLNIIEKGDLLHFQITDTGIGIAKEKIDLIFEAFVQLDGSLTRVQGGTGIGLTVVKQIIEAHNSKIIVRSTVGKGTIFEFYLPMLRG